jgi:protein phosphatase inhibitor 2
MSDSTQSSTKPHGILKKQSDKTKKKAQLRWDEESLAITEAQRGQSKIKINEPKTPFIYYNPDDDPELNEDIPSLELGDSVQTNQTTGNEHHQEWESESESEEEEEEMDEEEKKRHEEFLKKRAQHYNMREAILRARQLMSYDEDDSDEDEEDKEIPPVPPVPSLNK